MSNLPELLKGRPRLRYVFTGGKGGVGKTVSAAGLAYHYAEGGETVQFSSDRSSAFRAYQARLVLPRA